MDHLLAQRKKVFCIMSSANLPALGKYVKHIDTRLIIEWVCYDPETELLLVRWPTGSLVVVHRRAIVRIKPNEETEFLRSRNAVFA